MVKIKLFANFRETSGKNELEIEARDLKEVVEKLCKKYPDMKPLFEKRGYANFAINGRMIFENIELRDIDTVAIFPPVSGG